MDTGSNCDIPMEAETYVHRIGRTARAGAEGDAVSFCSSAEGDLMRGIERLIRTSVPAEMDHKYHSEAARRSAVISACPARKSLGMSGSRIVWQSKRSRGSSGRRSGGHGGR